LNPGKLGSLMVWLGITDGRIAIFLPAEAPRQTSEVNKIPPPTPMFPDYVYRGIILIGRMMGDKSLVQKAATSHGHCSRVADFK
jgi:hypothetical protein